MKPDLANFVDDFLGELLEGSAAIFAGAGLSVPAGFVDWRNLLRPLSKELGLNIDLESDLVTIAQFHVNANGSNRHRLHTAVVDALSPSKPPTKNHELLARLPVKTWWTTNYDKLLENALNASGKVVDVKSSEPQLAITRRGRDATLYKMHGDVDRPDEAVVTRDDYERYSQTREAFITALAGDLVSKTFLFLGFSFTDPNLAHVLSELRLRFTTNQRRHYALFRARTKLPGETEAEFEHYKTRQTLLIEDLKRYNVRVLLIDEYSEITELLQELLNRYRRRTVFVSASIANFAPWGMAAVSSFGQELGRALIASGSRVATGLGAGIGDAIFTGALREAMRIKSDIEDALLLRPFPRTGSPEDLAVAWDQYRREFISHSGIALFLFGNKVDDGELLLADGMVREFEIAKELSVGLLPIGATGSMAEVLSATVLADPESSLPDLDEEAISSLRTLAQPTDDLETLVPMIIKLIKKLQGNE